MNLLLIVIIGVGSGRYIIIYNQILEPFTQTVPDPRSARQEQFEAQGESLGRLPPPRVLLLKCSVNLSMQSARYFTNFTFRLSKKQQTTFGVSDCQSSSQLPKNSSSGFQQQLVWIFDKSGLASKNDYIYVYICLQGSSLGQESIVDYVDVSFTMIAALVIWLLICLFD